MNTTMADGAEQRLDAQIAEALFGQPGMSKMDVANRVRELRGDGPALLVPREAGQAERARFEAWAQAQSHRGGNIPTARDAGHPDVYAAPLAQLAWKSWQAALSVQPQYITDAYELGMRDGKALSAQPSPGGQGWPFVESPADFAERMVQALRKFDMLGAVRHVLIENPPALAARQPVGEVSVKKEDANNYCLILRALGMEEEGDPVAEVKALIEARDRQPLGKPVAWLVHWSDMPLESPEVTRSASRISEVSALTNPPRIVPLYAAQPAHAVDLGPDRFRDPDHLAEWLGSLVDGSEQEEWDAAQAAMIGVRAFQHHSAVIERLRDAVEGECDGLAITTEQAAAIFDHVLEPAPLIDSKAVGNG